MSRGGVRVQGQEETGKRDELELLKQLIETVRKSPNVFSIAGGVLYLIAAEQWITPPPGFDNLKREALILCLVWLCIVLACRDLIAQQVWERTVWRRPTLLFSGLASIAAVFATNVYVLRHPRADLLQLSLYILQWLLYFTPLEMLLVFLHYQQRVIGGLPSVGNSGDATANQAQTTASMFYEEYGE